MHRLIGRLFRVYFFNFSSQICKSNRISKQSRAICTDHPSPCQIASWYAEPTSSTGSIIYLLLIQMAPRNILFICETVALKSFPLLSHYCFCFVLGIGREQDAVAVETIHNMHPMNNGVNAFMHSICCLLPATL